MIEINKIYNEDCLIGMQQIDSESIDVILTDPPYLYLKNQKLDRPFNEQIFFSECKRVLKKDGFIVLFGRGTSFYRWNTMLVNLGFTFKEEFIWDKGYCTSPLMNISRVHETVSIHTKRNGTINKVKIPYLEMKKYDIGGIITDIKRIRTALKNTKSLKAILSFLENNIRDVSESQEKTNLTISSKITKEDRQVSCMRSIKNGYNEKSIIRTDYESSNRPNNVAVESNKPTGDRQCNAFQSIYCGMNEKSIIKERRDHYNTIHPTQKPVRLLERLLALVSKEGDLVLDPFSGSASTAIAAYNTNRNYIGFEIDEEYFDLSKERLKKHNNQLKLFV